MPIGVVIPRHADDVVAALEVCRRHEVPVFARGCGTGLAGQSVNAAVVFDFSKYMNHIAQLDPERRTARVQPGVICDRLRIEDPRQCTDKLRMALAWDGPAIIECVVDQHEPPYPARVQKDQVQKLVSALREGTPNRRRIALQMVKDMLGETSFEASPAHPIPDKLGRAAAKVADKLQDGNGGDGDRR